MIDLVVCSAAEVDYAEALSWYAERSVQVAERFDVEFDQALETIASDPERFPRCDERHSYYLMRRFPYQIIYRQHLDHWVVIAVAHTAQSPDTGRRDRVPRQNRKRIDFWIEATRHQPRRIRGHLASAACCYPQ